MLEIGKWKMEIGNWKFEEAEWKTSDPSSHQCSSRFLARVERRYPFSSRATRRGGRQFVQTFSFGGFQVALVNAGRQVVPYFIEQTSGLSAKLSIFLVTEPSEALRKVGRHGRTSATKLARQKQISRNPEAREPRDTFPSSTLGRPARLPDPSSFQFLFSISRAAAKLWEKAVLAAQETDPQERHHNCRKPKKSQVGGAAPVSTATQAG